jgi:HTH-type transcriptional regulator/antitoxin PezA
MNGINNRFRQLRESCGKSQEEFGKALGITKSGISDIERGKRNVTEQHIIMLRNWSEFPINTDWLRTGEGEMFVQRTRNQIITDFLGDLIMEEATFKKRLIEALAELDERDWESLEKLATKLTSKKD